MAENHTHSNSSLDCGECTPNDPWCYTSSSTRMIPDDRTSSHLLASSPKSTSTAVQAPQISPSNSFGSDSDNDIQFVTNTGQRRGVRGSQDNAGVPPSLSPSSPSHPMNFSGPATPSSVSERVHSHVSTSDGSAPGRGYRCRGCSTFLATPQDAEDHLRTCAAATSGAVHAIPRQLSYGPSWDVVFTQETAAGDALSAPSRNTTMANGMGGGDSASATRTAQTPKPN
jgi:hypothetical protein